MNREEYIAELKNSLAGLSELEISDAIAYCEEYFNEAESEHAAITELGSPSKFAAQLKAEAVFKEAQSESDSRPRTMKSLIWIIMGICALPIALPLALTAVILLFVMVLLLFVFILLVVILVVVFVYVAIASFVSGFMYMGAPADFMVHIGVSFICIGIAGFSLVLVYILMKKALPFFIQKLSEFYHRHKGGKKDEII